MDGAYPFTMVSRECKTVRESSEDLASNGKYYGNGIQRYGF